MIKTKISGPRVVCTYMARNTAVAVTEIAERLHVLVLYTVDPVRQVEGRRQSRSAGAVRVTPRVTTKLPGEASIHPTL